MCVKRFGILPDDYDFIRYTLATAAENHDLIVTSGGVSTGEEESAFGRPLMCWDICISGGLPFGRAAR